jgi:hypothetical protein
VWILPWFCEWSSSLPEFSSPYGYRCAGFTSERCAT